MRPPFVTLSVSILEAADTHSLAAESGVSRWWVGDISNQKPRRSAVHALLICRQLIHDGIRYACVH
jgi:hypothetical protein